MAEHKRIEPEELEVGMEVAYQYWITIGWGRSFRYPRWIGKTVKRITPKRTKAVLVGNGSATTFDIDLKKEEVYVPDEQMAYENECLNAYLESANILGYTRKNWRELYSLSDDELKEVHGYLTALDAILNKETRREENG